MRWIVGGKAAQRSAASTSQMGRFETQWLAAPKNFAALADLSGQWIDLVHGRRPPRGIVFDMDSSVSPTHGEQEMSVWNGHYACTCYHPLFVFNQFGDLERCALRAGNVHSADGWDDVLKPVVARYQARSHASIFERTRPLQCPRSTSFWRRSGSNTRSGYQPTRFCRAGSAICSRPHSDDLRTPCAPVPCQFQLSGRNLDQAPEGCGGLSSRSSGIPANLSPHRLHRDEHEPPGRARRCFLQQARDVRAMDQGGKGAIKWTRLSCRTFAANAAPASCARLQPRQFPAHAGDAGADQGLVADESEGQADQDRRESGEPRPLCRLPDGRGRHRTAHVPGDFAADRGATAAATTSASARRSMSCIREQPTKGVRPNAKENGQIRQSNTARTVGNVESHPPSRISASSQFRKRLPSTSVQGSSGESRLRRIPTWTRAPTIAEDWDGATGHARR